MPPRSGPEIASICSPPPAESKSGAVWSGQLAATVYSLLMTVKLWKLNARTWLSAYLQACADSGNQAPQDLNAFLPWAMDEARLASLRVGGAGVRDVIQSIDSS